MAARALAAILIAVRTVKTVLVRELVALAAVGVAVLVTIVIQEVVPLPLPPRVGWWRRTVSSDAVVIYVLVVL